MMEPGAYARKKQRTLNMTATLFVQTFTFVLFVGFLGWQLIKWLRK